MGLGGPVWHVSVSPRFSSVENALPILWTIAEDELRGVGTKVEWREVGNLAAHIRRRLTEKEMRYAAIDRVIDVRGTAEFRRRVRALRPYLPPQFRGIPDEALQ